MTERIVLADLDDGVRGAVADARERVAGLHGELIRWGLVVWTAGNVSERVVVKRADGSVERTGLFVIKPS
ncbi:MAG: L-ribulose-5-phosphate 4-epimerase, partial [Actinomyces succiniciruminis]|nr:L-ribulose-5-phosphate 4-epimerase [Actinomyces succiniciruminis]